MKPRLVFLVGPTAVGKSEVAVRLAKKLGAEIISCDSMQLYSGMDILVSKPSAALRRMSRHHLIGVVPYTREYNVARYRREATAQIKAILKRGKVPLLVGGTGLYMSVLLDGIFKAGSQSKRIRQRLVNECERLGSARLHEKLEAVDPAAASKIHPHDAKRITRALEAFEVSGKPISQLQKERRGLADEYDVMVFCLDMPRKDLYARIEKRVDTMFRQGLVAEVKRLSKKKLSRTAACAIGMQEIRGYLEGRYELEEARRLMKRNSRHYAKRQLTWFRKDKRIEWVKVGPRESAVSIAQRIGTVLSARQKCPSQGGHFKIAVRTVPK